jgi:hypothetical protein
MLMLFKSVTENNRNNLRRKVWRQSVIMPLLVLCLATLASPPIAVSSPLTSKEASQFQSWGKLVIKNSMTVFRLPHAAFLSEEAVPVAGGSGYRAKSQPAFAWTQSMMVLMLAAAAKCDPAYDRMLWSYVHTLGAYWRMGHGVGGFDVLPGKVPLDRYYDDNDWMTWGFLRAYAATRNETYLAIARRDFKFVLSGESKRLGGGIYWHEQAKTSKNTCSNAPAIIDALKLYSATGDSRYLTTAHQLYHWLNAHLLDRKDYLYFDHINLNGKIGSMTWSYNTGAMLIANVLFYRMTHKSVYLRRSEKLANAAQNRWVNKSTGGINDPGFFAWVLLDGYEQLYKIDHNQHWRNIVVRALNYVHAHCINARGLYAAQWDQPVNAIKPVKLINQACAGSAYFSLAANVP